MITVRNTSSASATVMMMWLVTVKVNGINPITLATRMNANSENTSGKNCIPSGPVAPRIISATNS